MEKQKTILLLGGSAQQLVAIKAAKELGLRTVLCDYLSDNPGQYEVDKYYNVSTTDVEAVYEVAKKEKVDGILAYASDPAALPAAIVCERLGLPTNPSKSVEILGFKHKFRQFLVENGFASPKNFTFSPKEQTQEVEKRLKNLKFPVVIKPTDSSGSKGVTMLDSTHRLQEAICLAEEYSRNKILIAEEYIQRGFPYVIGGDILVVESKIVLFGEMSCLRGDKGESLIPIGEKFPSGLNKSQIAKVHEELQRIIDVLGFQNGELNIEILLDENGIPHFLELGPRAGGNMIPIQLSDIFGIDLPKANVEFSMGYSVNIIPLQKEGAFATFVLHSEREGIFDGLKINDKIAPYIYRKCIYKNEGDKVEAFDSAGKAIGIVFLHFPNEKTLKEIYPNCENLIEIILK